MMKFPKIEDIILYEDDNILVLNKPPFLTSETDAKGVSLAQLMKKYCPQAMLCHRLDKETSGVILAAKSEEWYRYFSIQFEKRTIKKDYHALVEGVRKYEQMELTFPLSKKSNFKAVVDKRDGKPAKTIITSIENFKNYTLVLAQPVTGRFHQIRIHMASINAPMVGDELYGGKPFFLSQIKRKYRLSTLEEAEQPVMARAALHAAALHLPYPEGHTLSITAPYPKDYDTTLKLLKKFDSWD